MTNKVLSCVLFVFLWLCYACQEGQVKDTGETSESTGLDSLDHEIKNRGQIETSHAVPSHLEMSTLLQSLKLPYLPALLNSPDNLKLYTDKNFKALNLGVYGVDFGYMNVYGKGGAASDYIRAIKNLAESLEVGYYFKLTTMEQLAFLGKQDSLTHIMNFAYNQTDHYLRSVESENLSALIQTGIFIEGLYFATQIMKDNDSFEIMERIGVQKATLDNLLIMMGKYDRDALFADLTSDLQALKKEYDKIEIIYTYGDPIQKEVGGRLVVEDNTTSKMNITQEQQEKITEIVAAIRSKITQPQ